MDLVNKIKKTKLFNDKEKIELLAAFPNLNEEVKRGLESSIDDYDSSLKSIAKQFKADMTDQMQKIKQENDKDNPEITQAAEKYIQGLNKLIPNGS